MSDQFKILLVSTDQYQASEYAHKIKGNFADLPIKMEFSTDSSKALFDFQHNLHHLVIADVNMPNMDGPSLVREIRKIEGSTIVFLIGPNPIEELDSGVEFFQTPISNWTDFFNKILGVIPEDMKTKYNLHQKESELLKHLKEYSKKLIGPQDNNYEALQPILLIPDFFDLQASDLESEDQNKDISTKSIKQKQELKEEPTIKDKKLSKREIYTYIIEILILFLLLGLTIFFYLRGASKESSGPPLFSLANILAIISTFSFFGFFISKNILKNTKR